MCEEINYAVGCPPGTACGRTEQVQVASQCLCERVGYKDVQVFPACISHELETLGWGKKKKNFSFVGQNFPHICYLFLPMCEVSPLCERKDWHFISYWLTEGFFQCGERLLFYGALPFIGGVRHLLKAVSLPLFFQCPLCVNAPDLCPSMLPYGVSSCAQSTCMFTNGRRKKEKKHELPGNFSQQDANKFGL